MVNITGFIDPFNGTNAKSDCALLGPPALRALVSVSIVAFGLVTAHVLIYKPTTATVGNVAML